MTRNKLITIVMVSTIALLTLLVSVVFSQDGTVNANTDMAQGLDAPNIPLPPMTNPGIYMINYDGDEDPARYSAVGNLYTFNWSDVHVAPGVFNWTVIDNYLARVAGVGKRAAVGISTYNGRCCGGINAMPAWIWQNDPRAVVITGSCEISPAGGCPDGNWRVPRYWFRSYLDPYGEFITALGNKYKADPRVEWVSMGFGTYGENKAHGSQAEKDALVAAGLTASKWLSTTREIIDDYTAAFRTNGVQQKGLFMQIAPYSFTERERWDLANYGVPRGVGISLNGLAPDFNNAWRQGSVSNTCNTTNFCGMYDTIFQNYTSVPVAFETYLYMLCDNTETYWAMLSAMDKRADVMRLNDDLFFTRNPANGQRVENIPNQEVFAWMKDYLGKNAQNTSTVWVALREHRNPVPYCYAASEQTYYPEPGNYSFFLTQEDSIAGGVTVAETNVADTTYLGWCTGVTDPNGNPYPCYQNPYNPNLPAGREGWVARRTNGAGNPYMWFKINDQYLFGGDNTVKIAVTYADMGSDRFKLEYDSTTGLRAATVSGSGLDYVQKTNSNTWKTVTFLASNARMANGLTGGADFRLNSSGDGDEHIHLVMLNKDAAGFAGPPVTFTPSPTPTATPTPQVLAGSITGTVFNDLNRNGSWDNGEPPLAGAVINLRTPQGTLVRTQTTGSSGVYTLNNVPVGTYLLQEIPPSGYGGGVQIGVQIAAGATFTQNFPNYRQTSVFMPQINR